MADVGVGTFGTCAVIGTCVVTGACFFLAFTVTLQVYFFFPAFAVIVAVPFFFAVTTPFEDTMATVLFELLHFTFFLLFFSFNLVLFPTTKVTFFLFNWIFFFALATKEFPSKLIENINARTSVKLSTLLILFIRILPATLSVLKLSCFFAIVFSPPFPLNNFMKPLFSS